MSTGNQFKRNFSISMISMIVQFVQSLIVTSYVQRAIGVEAYGYIAVVVNIVNVAGILTVSLTSVSSRYMVIELQKGDTNSSKRLFSTICLAILCVSCICVLFFVFLSTNLTRVMVISPEYINEVTILVILVGADFIVQLVQVPYLSVYYYEERLYIYYFLVIFTNCTKICSAVLIFSIWKPVVWAVYMGALISDGIAFLVYFFHVKKKYRYLVIKRTLFNLVQLKKILKSGVWVSISKLAAILLSTCSTYLVNIFISAYMAGIYGSIAQLQSILSFMTIAIVNVYLPHMYKLYAENKHNMLIAYTEKGLKVISSILGIVVGGLIVFGNEFMSIWITEDYIKYSLLIILSVCSLHVTYSAELINQLLITVNKTKFPAIISVIAGIFNVLGAVLLMEVTGNGIYGIAIAQLIVGVVRAGIILPLYAAIQLKKNCFIFIKNQLKGSVPMVLTVGIGVLIGQAIQVESWMTLILAAGITGCIAILISILIDRDIRDFTFQFIKIH